MNSNSNTNLVGKLARRFTVCALGILLVPAGLLGAHADVVGGEKTAHESVRPNSTDTYHIRFYGNEAAEVAAAGDGDIDIYVYDADGDLVARDSASDSTPICHWVPLFTQTYTIHIVNREDYTVDYDMLAD